MTRPLLKKDGTLLRVGDVLTDFRGEKWVAEYWDEEPAPGTSGKITVKKPGGERTQTFYITVFDLFYLEREDR